MLAQPVLAATLKLKVLIVSTGNSFEDAGLDLMDDALMQMGVPFDVLDSSRESLTADRLYSGAVGNYNGIILTNSELYIPNIGSGFSTEEWAMLQNYERSLGVRESVLSGFPAINPALGLDYGMKNGEFGQVVVAGSNFLGQWKAPAGGPEFLEYMNVAKPFSVNDFAFAYEPFQQYVGEPAQYNGRPLVQPLLTWDRDPAKTLLSIVRYPDGREVLFSTIAQAPFLLHSQALAYEFVNFATRGVFIGARKVYLAAHVDDVFLSNDRWNSELNINDESLQYRMVPEDVTSFVTAQKVLRERYPVMKNIVVDFAFNGFGASPKTSTSPAEPLTASIISNKNAFRFINHTYSHFNMNTSTGMDYTQSTYEINQNMKMWRQLGLPDAKNNTVVMVAGEHSGLRDDNGTADTSDDLQYPQGRNLSFLQAAFDSGIRYLASDSSRINQNVEAYVPGMNILLLPRYPTNIFFNTTTPEENVDEYNFIFHERHLLEGKDPCTIPGAICVPRDYAQILAAEADGAVRHMLTFRAWPHYFHQTNLYRYNLAGDSLLSDWLTVVAERYSNLFTLPVKSQPYYQTGSQARDRLRARGASVDGQIDTVAGTVTIWAKTSALTPVTGVEGGAVYGGQLQRDVSVGVTPISIRINRCDRLTQC